MRFQFGDECGELGGHRPVDQRVDPGVDRGFERGVRIGPRGVQIRLADGLLGVGVQTSAQGVIDRSVDGPNSEDVLPQE